MMHAAKLGRVGPPGRSTGRSNREGSRWAGAADGRRVP